LYFTPFPIFKVRHYERIGFLIYETKDTNKCSSMQSLTEKVTHPKLGQSRLALPMRDRSKFDDMDRNRLLAVVDVLKRVEAKFF